MTKHKPDMFTLGTGAVETIKGMTEGLGAALADVTFLREQRDLEDEEGPARGLESWESLWAWLRRRENHAHRTWLAVRSLGFLLSGF